MSDKTAVEPTGLRATLTRMKCLWLVLGLALAPGAFADPLKSAPCANALAALETARHAKAANVEPLRQEAMRQCLGAAQPAAARGNRWAQPPVAVPAPTIEPPRPPATAIRAPEAPPPPVAIERAPTVSSCDANGCWTSDGTRLNRVGPNLVGPQGICTLQGPFALCR